MTRPRSGDEPRVGEEERRGDVARWPGELERGGDRPREPGSEADRPVGDAARIRGCGSAGFLDLLTEDKQCAKGDLPPVPGPRLPEAVRTKPLSCFLYRYLLCCFFADPPLSHRLRSTAI